MLLLVCYDNTREQIALKQLILAALLVFVPKYCLISLMVTFHVSLSLLKFTQFMCTNTASTVLPKWQIWLIWLLSINFLFFNFETRISSVWELTESIFGLVPNKPVKIEPSNINKNSLCFNVISDGNITVYCPFLPCILSNVNKKPMGVLQLFCDHPDLTWEHVNKIPSRALTNIPKVPNIPFHGI